MRRVVVTGIGIVSPLGCGLKTNWDRITASQSGLGRITRFDSSDLPVHVAGEVKFGKDDPSLFDPDRSVPFKDQRKMDLFIQYAMAAADEAVADSGWAPANDEDRNQTGVLVGSGIGGLSEIQETSIKMHEGGRVSPFFIPASLINLASGQISIKHGFRGPNHSVVTACATGAHAIGDAARMIALGDADVMVAGGAESAICKVGMSGFAALKALSTKYNDTPEKASRPYDEGRDGFVMGEGAGVVILEEYEHAKKRGAKIYGEVAGYGLSGDAYHMTAPPEDGNGGERAMRMALKRAGIDVSDIGYVNAHGTSTPLGDEIELNTIRRVFGSALDTVAVSSTKSAIGHLLGAAGAVEAIYSLMAMQTGILPPTLNLDNPSEGCKGVNLVAHTAQEKKITAALSNSFGFGGTNACLIFKAV